MAKNPLEDLLVEILDQTAHSLLKRIKDGTASHQDISNAIKLLKDNGIDCSKGSPTHDVITEIGENLPYPDPSTIEPDIM